MLGVVNLDKPVGPTSHDMVAMMRRLSGTRRIGHAGTLDPLASGVLPLLVGAATRFSEELTGGRKRYDAVIRLGARSETDDSEGPIELLPGPMPTSDDVLAALGTFVGTFDQLPPSFSARKVGGRVAHRAARAGDPIDVPPRAVTIDTIEVIEYEPIEYAADIRIDLRCGAGTYVRSLARDLGERLQTGAYLRSLRRTEAAGLSVETSVTPDMLEALALEDRLADAVLPVGELLPFPHLALDSEATLAFQHGSARPVHVPTPDGKVAVFSDEVIIGIGWINDGILQPHKVLPPPPPS
ncbi:MAG: tRNA pseudouridine(55) synthase TruB [Candidatus Limnocylindria bacterium]